MEKNLAIKHIKENKYVSKYKKILLLVMITIFIEIFICNYPAIRTILLGNQNQIANYEFEGDKITISDVGVRATSIYIEYENVLIDKISYMLSYIAEEDDNVIKLNDKIILENQKHYINFDTHSTCEKIEIELLTNSNIHIKQILINHPNFHINIYRILIIFCIMFGISKLTDKNTYKELFDPESKNQRNEFLLILVIICLIITSYTIQQQELVSFYIQPNQVNLDDALLMQTEAFMNRQIPLQVEVDEELKTMEDPYNFTEKVNKNIPFLYDVAYYDGNYYSYFGIAPIITTILPFRLLTGGYTYTYIFNLVYIFGIIFLLYDVYRKLVKKYMKKVSLCHFYLGYFAILTASNILTALRGQKYDIVTTCGIMFILLAISLAIRLGESKKYKIVKLVGIGISTALIVLSKPTFIVYYPFIAFFVWTSMRNLENKEKIKDIFLIAIPIGIFAILQMVYNYVRFDSPLEFGAKYQFTSFNMQYCMSFSIGKIYAGILEYIFKLPNINLLRFPFVFINTDMNTLSMNEICYENRIIGLIAIPILWIFVFANSILKKKDQDLKVFTKISLITTLVAIIINTCTGGICEAYSIDFKCILAINAIILLLRNIEIKHNTKEANQVFVLLCICTILIMLPINLTTESNWLSNMASSTTVFFRNIFEFWS